MKRLCLVRHAKSSWNHPSVDDTERPLDPRGEVNAGLMGDKIKAQGVMPDIILTSHAKRAHDTARIVAKRMGLSDAKLIAEEAIYEAGVEDLLLMLQKLDAKYSTIILVGHNPGLTYLANYLVNDHVHNLPTCGVYCIDFATDSWAEITAVEGKTLFQDQPQHPA